MISILSITIGLFILLFELVEKKLFSEGLYFEFP